jgi:hypothetical protein
MWRNALIENLIHKIMVNYMMQWNMNTFIWDEIQELNVLQDDLFVYLA